MSRPMARGFAASVPSSSIAPVPHLCLNLPTVAHTVDLGKCLGRDARPGDVLCLRGDLGAGKTAFARGYVRSARGDDSLDVTSPTYCLDNTYPPQRRQGGLGAMHEIPTIHHMDLWRLQSASTRSFVDFDTVFRDQISLIEWPERLGELLPTERLDVCIEYIAQDESPVIGASSASGRPLTNSPEDWGFVDADGDGGSNESTGRVVTLTAYSGEWSERLEKMVMAFELAGLAVLTEWEGS